MKVFWKLESGPCGVWVLCLLSGPHFVLLYTVEEEDIPHLCESIANTELQPAVHCNCCGFNIVHLLQSAEI